MVDYRDELLIPIGPNISVPGSMGYHGQAIGVGDPTKIAESLGRSYKPQRPLYLVAPDKRTVIFVAGMGVAEASELEDLALAALDKEKDNDWEGTREAHGLPQQDTLMDNLGNLIEDRWREEKRNQRTQGQHFEKRIY